MSKRINYILAIFTCILFLSGCSIARIPVSYRFNPRNLNKQISGNWIEITPVLLSEVKLSGELIAIQSDTVYVLTDKKLSDIPLNKIGEATLYIYYNNAGMYAFATGLLFLPDVIAAMANNIGGFLAIGAPWAVTGSIITYLVGTNNSNLMIYPFKNHIEDFKKFARFPQGMPAGIVKDKLRLVITK